MTKPILPTATEILGAATLYLATNRPTTKPHLTSGRYASVLEGFKNQEQTCLARVAEEIAAARVPTSSGKELFDLLQGEFDANVIDQPTYAVGEVTLYRHTPTKPGLIRAGTRFRRKGDPAAVPARLDAVYESTEPVYVGSADSYAVVQIRCTQIGTVGNILPDSLMHLYFKPVDTLFDTAFDVISTSTACAGGSDNLDVKLKSLGRYLSQGQYGPNCAAIVAGLLSTPGVSRFALSEDLIDGIVCAWPADDSWATSAKLRSMALQELQDNWLGWGCKADLGLVKILPIAVSAVVVLRSKRFAGDTAEILANIRAAVRGYFSDRADWYTWTIDGIVGAIVGSDRRIASIQTTSGTRNCTVTDALTGSSVSPPARILPTDASAVLYHYHVDDTNVQIDFKTPSAT